MDVRYSEQDFRTSLLTPARGQEALMRSSLSMDPCLGLNNTGLTKNVVLEGTPKRGSLIIINCNYNTYLSKAVYFCNQMFWQGGLNMWGHVYTHTQAHTGGKITHRIIYMTKLTFCVMYTQKWHITMSQSCPGKHQTFISRRTKMALIL